MNIVQTPSFCRCTKKLHKNQRDGLDAAVVAIASDPSIGESKKGDLAGVQVYKFKMVNQLTLLAYQYDVGDNQVILLALGTHENFYRDLKK